MAMRACGSIGSQNCWLLGVGAEGLSEPVVHSYAWLLVAFNVIWVAAVRAQKCV